ncbi:MAG: ComEC/Rec2 family competence protein [Solirubrobacteraceae bacterium]
MRRARPVARAALRTIRAHPRHLLLACLVAGLLAFGSPPVALAVATLAGALGGRRGVLGLAATGAVLIAALLAQERVGALDRTALGPLLGHDVTLRATLLERPRRSRSRSRHALCALASGPGRGERVVLGLGRGSQGLHATPGMELEVHGFLRELGPYDDHLRRRGAHARLVVDRVRPTGVRRHGLAGWVDAVRAATEASVASGLDPPRAALARGMVLGEDEALSDADRRAFRASGLAHLLAASGQNVMLLAALAVPALAALGLGLRGRLAGALALIAVYVPIAGAGPSIQRAGVMGAAAIVAGLAGRPTSRWYALLLAAAFTLAVNPRAAQDPGWQLSFAAVVAILGLAGRLRDALVARRLPRGLAEAIAVTASATAATAPLLSLHFGRLSLVSLPANLLAVPAVAPVMWLGLVAAGVGAVVPAGAALVNALAQFPLGYLGWLAAAAAAVPGASLPARLGSPAVAFAAYGVAAATIAVGWRLRAAVRRGMVGPVLAVAAVAAAGLAGGRPAPPDPRRLVVSFLDVGQGDATLVQHGGASILVDTGPPGGPLLRRLREAGVRRLDVLVVTHAQADHEGEAAAVLERYPVGFLLDGGDGTPTREHRMIVAAASRHGVPRTAPDAGQELRAGPLTLDVLWPRREPAALHAGEDPNRRAIVAVVRDGDFDLLLPADAESDVTAALDLPPVEALKVAHHGSEDPGLPDLLARVRPRLAVIEVGRHNFYGHPSAQALAALRAVPALYRTDRDGTVRLTVAAGRMAVAGDP